MKIRYKFISGLIFILIVSMIIMNVSITNVLKSNMENNINNFSKQLMNSTHEYIKYTLETNSSKDKKESLVEEGIYIVKHISLNYECKCDIRDINYKLVEGNSKKKVETIVKDSNKIAMGGKAVVDLNYKDNVVEAILSYPIYIDNEYIGIVNIVKNYNGEYRNYKNTMNIINVIEAGIFIVIFIFLFLRTNKITEPIAELTNAIKKLGCGDYDTSIAEHGKDEVAILEREFVNMRDKIKEQIKTIESEKNKVYKLEKGRREFFNSVTHELKTPLTAISGYAELLLTGMVKDEDFDKRAIERIYSESGRLHKLVLDLIEVSKGMCVIKEELNYINIKELITEICNDMNIKAKKYSLKIIQNISEGTVKVEQNKIRQVIINVVDNAIKYSSGGYKIYVNSYILENKYIIEVINNSNPIPENIFNNIFEPFIKSDNGNKESRGLGLYLCNEIIKEHDGEITIENGSLIKTKIQLPIGEN